MTRFLRGRPSATPDLRLPEDFEQEVTSEATDLKTRIGLLRC